MLYRRITQTLKSLFRDQRQFNLFKILLLSTLFDCGLVAYRIFYTQFDLSSLTDFSELKTSRGVYGTFFFLIWNLILAWVPYLFALALDFYTRRSKAPSVAAFSALLALWLLFFPNAPYIVTDLLHLKDRHVVPHWYDLMLIVSFAWTGLMLGYCSIFEIQHFLEQKLKKWMVSGVTIAAIWLGGFGVYMGRFQRLNSWDIFTHPFSVVRQQVHVILNPLDNFNTLGMAIVLSGFMMIGYFTLNELRRV